MMYQVIKNCDSWKVVPLRWLDAPDICLRLHKIDADSHFCYVCFPGIVQDADYLVAKALVKGMRFIKTELAHRDYWRDELGRVRV